MKETMFLPEAIIYNRFNYKLVERNDDFAIYEQWNHGVVKCYEVFKIKKIDGSKMNNPHFKEIEWTKNYQFKEKFPKDEDFGYTAWTYKTVDDARKKYQSLVIG